jgi:hypothetical protein
MLVKNTHQGIEHAHKHQGIVALGHCVFGSLKLLPVMEGSLLSTSLRNRALLFLSNQSLTCTLYRLTPIFFKYNLMKIKEVNITKIKTINSEELSDNVFRICNFCDKPIKLNLNNLNTCQNLCGKDCFCPFCIRFNHHHRHSRHILPFSYRGIIGYYYYKLYLSNPPEIYYSQIVDIIKKHKSIGLQSPIFYYDEDNFMWYLNFNLIGNQKNKAPYSEVKRVVGQMLNCFKLNTVISPFAQDHMQKKFDKAIELFYQQRKRPKNKKTLIPTLEGTSSGEKSSFYEQTRSFTYFDFVLN